MKNTSSIPLWQALLSALLIFVLLTLDSGDIQEGQLVISFNRTLITGINYLLWALSVNFIYSFVISPWSEHNRYGRLLLSLLIVVFLQLIISNLIFFIVKYLVHQYPIQASFNDFVDILPKAIISRIIDLIVIIVILRAFDSQRKMSTQKLQLAELKGQVSQAKLEALKMQLNPHFLFNALHAVHSMIGYDNKRSKKMLLQLSDLLRQVLELGEVQLVALKDELTFFQNYLAIESERFHDRLQTEIQVDEAAKSCMVPSLLLQPLLENALKHGIASLDGPGEINLKVIVENKRLDISLSNSMDIGHRRVESTGIGLQNTTKRLEAVYGNNFHFETSETTNRYIVNINLPCDDL